MTIKKLMSSVLISFLVMGSSHAVIIPEVVASESMNQFEQINHFSEIDNIFTQYQYEMDGWDGSDLQYKADAEGRLMNDLDSIVASGVKAEDIQSVMEGKILGVKAKAEYRAVLAAMKVQNASRDDIIRVSMNLMKNAQPSGSAFASDGARINYKRIAVIAGAVIVAAVTVVLIKNCKEKKVDPKPPIPPAPPVPPSDPKGNNGWGNGDQDAPGNSCSHNNAENQNCG